MDDWVLGVGGSRLNATGRCIFAMRITGKITFNDYWSNMAYFDKRPVRNGSKRMLVGDNIYHCDAPGGAWCQADSHHSNSDGSVNTDILAIN
jgi:Nucleotide modification associated domain 2